MQISEGYAAIHGFPDGTSEIARNEWWPGLHPEDRLRLEEIRSRHGEKEQIVALHTQVNSIETQLHGMKNHAAELLRNSG
jgi:hypothetical protein